MKVPPLPVALLLLSARILASDLVHMLLLSKVMVVYLLKVGDMTESSMEFFFSVFMASYLFENPCVSDVSFPS